MKKLGLLLMIGMIPVIAFSQSATKVWESDSLFLKPESALYDSSKKIVYISNINGEYLAKYGNGFISKIKTNGQIEVLKWIDGLDNPQGMALFKNKLFVADINKVLQINTNTSKIEKVYKVDSAKFFNDVTSDAKGDIYISDCFDNKIYKISDGEIKVWLESDFLSMPNGLLCRKDEVLILNMKSRTAFAVNKSTGKAYEIFNRIDNLDGIASDGGNGLLVSGAWQGQVFHIDSKGNKKLIIDLGKEKIAAADIEYIAEKKLLIVPTLNKTVLGYHLE
ncbi:Periplasmic ATP/GTP-binding protein [Flavobacterium anhuiense]|uniref:Periplasmic ATP/GTP-binding protein n=1 Tax=Flavobacterium anhuiense TaxID=459526 RepID=A0A444VS10_9FLAO|nr:SMP-30/gluconolactonase/LRE family protein [Flavobacterium anhuiense]RYJ36419.1 Periplasmic ATP/GTP-binding protein [Flavobacterium anhuiense]